MANLSFIEKQIARRLFGISDGYVFKYWSDRGEYNKNTTQQLILDACGIDIYKDKPFNGLSQQKCIEKIWDECGPQMTAKLLKALSEYFCFAMGSDGWGDEDGYDYRQIEGIIERLNTISDVTLPKQESADLNLILNDIEGNIQSGKPELVIDRLHTFATKYIREICQKHSIDIVDEKGNYYALDSLIARLKKWYEEKNFFESEFCVVAIKNTINIFSKYNDLRNANSAAHPNQLLQKAEAEFAVRIVADTLMFIDNIEKTKKTPQTIPRGNGVLVIDYDEEELPF